MMMTTAIEPVMDGNRLMGVAPLRAGRPIITADSLVAEGQQRQLLMKYVAAHMREGTDYGSIPGTDKDKKSLLKPGAEKLVDLFRCVPEFEIIEKTIDWDRPLFHYLFRCRIVTLESGAVVAEGVGSANSHESKYRYRNEDRKCPECGKAAIKKSKFPPRSNPNQPPGFYCYAKVGGCGIEFAHNDPAIIDQPLGKVENMDAADSDNTILKMAKKRALVDAAIALVRCSDMFTQDIEEDELPHVVETRRPHMEPPFAGNAALCTQYASWVAGSSDRADYDAACAKIAADKAKFTAAQLTTLREACAAWLASQTKPDPVIAQEEPGAYEPGAYEPADAEVVA